MTKQNDFKVDVPMLNDHQTRKSRQFAWMVALTFGICSLIVIAAYFSGRQISWHIIDLTDSQITTTQLPTSVQQNSDQKLTKLDNYYKPAKMEKNEIYKSYKSQADKIIEYLTKGAGKNQAYNKLAFVADKFGHRMTGSDALNRTIDYLVDTLTKEGLDNVHKEEALDMPNWVRGKETATLLSPKRADLKILGLGNTVSTPNGDELCADAVVVRSFGELTQIKDKVSGKIVVYYQPWVDYPTTVEYRENGASAASKYGAVAVLVRSVTNHSSYTPHTGMMSYADGVKPIPAACMTVEDAAMLYRMQARGDRLKICMHITSHPEGTVTSHNTVAEILGSEKPDEIVLISGHLDSWDVGTGAMDDGGGVIIAWQALSTMKALGLRPKRTIRAVFWTAEEQGHVGSAYYYGQHKKWSNETYRFVYESDTGAFKPKGLNFSGTPESKRTMTQVMSLLDSIDAGRLFEASDTGDVDYWRQDGVPAAWLEVEDKLDYYFRFHHTQADNVIVFEPEDLDYATALTAVVAYVVADMDAPLPHGPAIKV